MNTTYELLIIFIFNNDSVKTIKGVEKHGFDSDSNAYYFVKNGYVGFLPKENIKYFGRKFDWEENEV